MNRIAVAQNNNREKISNLSTGILQRKCTTCSNKTSAKDECTECANNKSKLQRKLSIGASNDPLELEADRVADQVMNSSPNSCISSTAPRIQRASTSSGGADTSVPASVNRVLSSSGRSMKPGLRQEMEHRFSQDFSQVRLHTDDAAAKSARDVSAHAYTAGNNVVFGSGQFAPNSFSGKKLLAHELTHVVQQSNINTSNNLIGLKVRRRSVFQEFAGLFAGESFDAATLQAYLDFLILNNRIEDFTDSDNKARAIVNIWKQGASPYTLTAQLKILLIQEMQSGFTGNDDENAILELLWRSDNSTLSSIYSSISAADLNSDFHGSQWEELQVFYTQRFVGGLTSVLAGTITPQGSAVPLGVEIVGLQVPDANTRTRAMAAINTEVRTSSGALPTFSRNIVGEADAWEIRVKNAINTIVTSMHGSMVVARPPRVAANMFADVDINRVAGAAQSETDGVFSQYYGSRPSFEFGVNIFDAFVRRDTVISASSANADQAANFRVLKLLNGHRTIAAINQQHGAIYTRAAEWALIAPILGFPLAPVLTEERNSASPPHVTTGIIGTRRLELLDIHRNWPAFAGNGRIFMDVMKGPDNSANRDMMYDIFGTVIHEYMHTLEHPDHRSYRNSLAAQQGGFVLREGMTEYLTKIVWDQVNFNPVLRATIEGSFQDPLNPNGHSIQIPPRYDEWRNARDLANIVGLLNVKTAFFLGRVDLIGA